MYSRRIEQQKDRQRREDRGKGPGGKIAGAENVAPGAQDDRKQRRMRHQIHMCPDRPPGRSIREACRAWNVLQKRLGWQPQMKRASATGELEVPKLVHEQALLIDPMESRP